MSHNRRNSSTASGPMPAGQYVSQVRASNFHTESPPESAGQMQAQRGTFVVTKKAAIGCGS
jgi:hypothetical protein